MTLANFKRISAILSIVSLVFLSCAAVATAGPIRIILNDGNTIEVPYYWVTDGEFKFDIPGGIAGVPRGQVAAVQEVLVAKEFDPEVLVKNSVESTTPDQRQLIQDLAGNKATARCDIANPEEGLKRLKAGASESEAGKPVIRGQKYHVEKTIANICDESGGPVVMIQELASSNGESMGRDFNLILYDSEGKVISKKPCEVVPLTLNQDAQKRLGVRGPVYLIRATIRPNPSIKRYEIASVAR
jgi:hypothetical protein